MLSPLCSFYGFQASPARLLPQAQANPSPKHVGRTPVKNSQSGFITLGLVHMRWWGSGHACEGWPHSTGETLQA